MALFVDILVGLWWSFMRMGIVEEQECPIVGVSWPLPSVLYIKCTLSVLVEMGMVG